MTGKKYWADWIVHCCSKKLCIKRDIYSDDNAYIYDGNNGKFIGVAEVDYQVAALARTPEEKAHLHKKMERKRLALKEIKNFLSTLRPVPIEEQLENYKCVYASENEEQEQQNPKIVKVLRTKMDDVLKQAREMEEREKLRSALLEFESGELDKF